MRIRGLLFVGIVTMGLASPLLFAAPAADAKPAAAADADKKTDGPMDTLTFFSKIIPALAWPLVTLILARRFAPEIRDLLKRVTSIKGFGLDAQLALANQEANANHLPPAHPPGHALETKSLLSKPTDTTFGSLMQVDPAAAISWKWVQLEDAIIRLNGGSPTTNAARPTSSQILNAVPEQYRSLFTRLGGIRNSVVHKVEAINPQQATQFAELSDRLLTALSSAGQ